MWFHFLQLRSALNISSALRQVVHGTRWHAKRKSYKVLFWREITPLAVPIFMENACVLLMGVLSTFLVSWLGKDAMAGVGLADSFNMVIMAFFAAIDLGTTVVVAFSLGKRDRRRARVATRQSLVIMTLFAVLLATLIHHFGEQIIDFVAGDATTEVKALALTYLELTVLSYPAAAITLIGSGALRGAGNTKIPLLINGSLNILNIIISGILIYGLFSWPGLGFVGAGLGLIISRYIGAVAILWVLAIGFNPALRISLKSYFKPLNFSIIWEVMVDWYSSECRISVIYQWSVINPNVRCRDGDQCYCRKFYRVFNCGSYQLTRKCARLCFYDHYRPKVVNRPGNPGD